MEYSHHHHQQQQQHVHQQHQQHQQHVHHQQQQYLLPLSPVPHHHQQQQQQQQQRTTNASRSPVPPVGYITSPATVNIHSAPASALVPHARRSSFQLQLQLQHRRQSHHQYRHQHQQQQQQRHAVFSNAVSFNSTESNDDDNQIAAIVAATSGASAGIAVANVGASIGANVGATSNANVATARRLSHRHSYSCAPTHNTHSNFIGNNKLSFRPRLSVASATNAREQRRRRSSSGLPSTLSASSVASLLSPAMHRTSIASKMSSLTRDSGCSSFNDDVDDVNDVTHAHVHHNHPQQSHGVAYTPFQANGILYGRNIEQTVVNEMYKPIMLVRNTTNTTNNSNNTTNNNGALFVHGPAGVGKTSLIMNFIQHQQQQQQQHLRHHTTTSHHTTFCHGSYATTTATTTATNAASGISVAFRNLCEQLPDQDRSKVRSLVRRSYANKPNRQQRQQYWKFIQSIPVLHVIVGNIPQPNLQSLPKKHADVPSDDQPYQRQQLFMIFRQILRIVSTSNHSVVMYLDEIQNIGDDNEDSYEFIASLLSLQHFLFIATYKSDDAAVSPAFSSFLKQLRSSTKATTASPSITTTNGTSTITMSNPTASAPDSTAVLPQITSIRLGNLTLDAVQEMLSDLTSSHNNASEIAALAQVVYDHTHGNPSSVLRFLNMLQKRRALQFRNDDDCRCWCWDLEHIRRAVREEEEDDPVDGHPSIVAGKDNGTNNGPTTITGIPTTTNDWQSRIDRVPQEGKTLLTLAACIGMTFDSKMLQYLAIHLGLLDEDYQAEMKHAMQAMVEEAVSGRLIHPDQVQEMIETQMSSMMEENADDESLRQSFYEESLAMGIGEAEIQGLIRPIVSSKIHSIGPDGKRGDGGAVKANPNKHRFADPTIYQHFLDKTPAGSERAKLHLGIGRALKLFYKDRPEDDILFAAVDHLHRGASQLLVANKKNNGTQSNENEKKRAGVDGDTPDMEKPLDDVDRVSILQLHIEASRKAKAQSAFFLAADVLTRGIDLVKQSSDWTDHYDVVLELYSEAADAYMACGRMEDCLRKIHLVQKHGKSLSDKLHAQFTRIQVLQSQGKLQDAMRGTQTALEHLGLALPNKMYPRTIKKLTKVVRLGLRDVDEATFIGSPKATDQRQGDRLRFLNALAMIAYHQADNDWMVWAYLEMMRLSVERKVLCDYTPAAFAGYGLLLAMWGDNEQAYHFSKLAISISDRLENEHCMPITTWIVYSHLHHLGDSLLDSVSPLLAGYQTGISTGNVEYATRCIAASAAMGFACALPLKPYKEDMQNVCAQLKSLRQMAQWRMAIPFWQAAECLLGQNGTKNSNSALEDCEEHAIATKSELENSSSSEKISLLYHCFLRCLVSYIFCHFEEADHWRRELHKRRKHMQVIHSHFLTPMMCLFSGLVCFRKYDETGKRKYRRKGNKIRKELATMISSDSAVLNYQGMLQLLDAEKCPASHRNKRRLYEDAIHSFANAGWIHLQAIAVERYANVALGANDSDRHEDLLRTAVRLYADWGAMAKVKQLGNRYHLPSKFWNEHLQQSPSQGYGGPSSTANKPSSTTRLMRFTPLEEHKEEDHASSDTFGRTQK